MVNLSTETQFYRNMYSHGRIGHILGEGHNVGQSVLNFEQKLSLSLIFT